ncbi:MAG: cellulase family glycosylhydrolase, partial [Pyrinomonadaceae bacterium]
LVERLNSERVELLITPYGSAFPKRAWPALIQYLRSGGNWVNLGGVPFAIPIIRKDGQWRAETSQTAYHKRLGITQSFPVRARLVSSYRAPTPHGQTTLEYQFTADVIYELYVRLTSTSDTPSESGSDGPREAVLHTLVFVVNHEERRVAAPIVQIDRLLGEFAGGRWVLANFKGSITAQTIRKLSHLATQGAFEFVTRSEFACYRSGEIPSISVEIHRPAGELEKITNSDCRLEIRDARDQPVSILSFPLKTDGARARGSQKLKDGTRLSPGFYRVESRVAVDSTNGASATELSYTTGFWVYDHALITRGKPLTVDSHFFYRDGSVYPVTGTTYMASDVHRKFLLDPNPFIWDQDFREMKDAGVNMVRTGIWTGWRKYMPEPGKVNDTVLRALDAFLFTAHKYDIPVIFTFFAFLPETWGGANAYLDPVAVQAQQQFVSTFANRYRAVDDLIWDLINEPSFSSSQHLWSCRPNYDSHEQAAWQRWLEERYPYPTEEERATALRELWRSTSDDSLDLPRLEDFEGVNIFDDRRPLKTLDYRLFAQEMFAGWVRAMTAAIRSNGNQKQLITVGQDEGGAGDRPNPQFFAETVDFTCLHNWWNNDDLVWDSVITKSPSKLNLVEETGIMFYERMDGGAWRTEEDARDLLERKIAISLGTDGAGVIQWIWNTNSYMNSDNEVAIGFYRADQTAKPELEPFLKIAKFVSAHRQGMRDRQDEDVLMVIPHSQMFTPRNFATEATRKSVRAMYYHCRISMRAVSEYKLHEFNSSAKLIVVPAPRVLTGECWDALLARARSGATVVISGAFEADEHWVPRDRLKSFGWSVETKPVSQSELIFIGERPYHIRYEGEKIQRIEKAGVRSDRTSRVLVQPVGQGRLIWSPLPLEVGESLSPVVAFYRLALKQAGVSPLFRVDPDTPSILVLPSRFAEGTLYTFVSESDRNTQVRLRDMETGTQLALTVPAQRALLVLIDRRSGRVVGSTATNNIVTLHERSGFGVRRQSEAATALWIEGES